MQNRIKIEVSIGEAIDKLSILLIKLEMISSKEKLEHIKKEIDIIQKELLSIEISNELKEIKEINKKLWNVNEKRKKMIEDNIFDNDYLELTKQESILNDERFKIKQNINFKFDSFIQEQKSYGWS